MNERLRDCESERERVCESESVRVTFEHRDENKSCSAWQECLNERLKEWRVRKSEIVRESENESK